MKKNKIILLLMVLLFSFTLIGCGELEPNEEPGSYLFDIDTYKSYVDVEVNLSVEEAFLFQRLHISINVEPKQYAVRNDCYFYNCYIYIEINANNENMILPFKLESNGELNTGEYVTLESSNYSNEYKIINASGEVDIKVYDGAILEIDGIKYEVCIDKEETYVYRISGYDIYDKILVYDKYINYSLGKLPVKMNFEYSSETFMGLTTGNVEVLILKGTYSLSELNEADFFENLYRFFPKLKVLAIENIEYNSGSINQINMPNNDIDVYLTDNDGSLRNQLMLIENVKNIYDYNDFSMKYIKRG